MSIDRIHNLDFLRGIAILSVLATHTAGYFPTGIGIFDFMLGQGRYGVQLFYIISGITMCYMWDQRRGESYPVIKFYLRRFFRIAPLFWISILLYLIISGTGPSYWAPEGLSNFDIISTFLFVHGFWPTSINSVVPGGWSIAVEMTFYAIFPILMYLIYKNHSWYLYIGIIFYFINDLFIKDIASDYFSTHYQSQRAGIIDEYLFLYFLNQAPVFLIGCYLYFVTIKKSLPMNWFILLGAAFINFFFHLTDNNFLLVIAIISCFVYICMNIKVKIPVLEIIGRYSYSMYLTHFAIIYILSDIFGKQEGILSYVLFYFIVIVINLILSRINYVLIERHALKFVRFINEKY